MKVKPIYIELLKFLEEYGVTNKVNISNFMIAKYGIIENNNYLDPNRVQAQAILYDLLI